MVMAIAVAELAEALRYKPVGRRFDSRRGSLRFFTDLIRPAALTEMSTRCVYPGG
jgi:hypothetical protein